MAKIIKILNGDVNSYIRIVFIALLVGFGAFLFNFTTDAYKVFATKAEVQVIQERMDNRLGRIEDGINDINKFLRK